MADNIDHQSDDSDEGFLEGDIVDNIFNQKGANAHLEMDFDLATKHVRSLAGSAKQEDLLYFYGRYKQVTVGPCNAPKPSFYQLTEKSKWNAWQELGQKSRTESQLEYIQRLTELCPEWRGQEVGEAGGPGWVSVSSLARSEKARLGEETVWDHVQEGNIEHIRQLEPPLTSLTDQDGLTLLHWATDRGHAHIVELLLQKDKDLIDLRDKEGQTALHYGTSCGHGDIVKILLSHGADISLCDNEGLKPCNDDTEPAIQELFRLKLE